MPSVETTGGGLEGTLHGRDARAISRDSSAPSLDRIQSVHFLDADEKQIRPLAGQTVSHFDVFGLEPRLVLDEEALRDAFLTLSRRFHPDFHATESEDVRREILQRSSLINNAYKTLRNPQKRAEYLITLIGRGIESNKGAVPPELLEEMFDIQEAGEKLREARLATDEARLASAEARIKPLRDEVEAARQILLQRLQEQFHQHDEYAATGAAEDSPARQQVLRDVRLSLDRMNYLRTVLRNLR